MIKNIETDINNPEVLLVAGALLRPALASEAAQYVEHSDFEDIRLGQIWLAITGMLNEGLKEDDIDVVAVGKRFSAEPEVQLTVARFCDKLIESMPRVNSLVMSAHRVRRRATMRLALEKMREIATNLKSQIESADGDVPDLDETLAQLSVAVSSRSDKELRRVTFKDLALQVEDYFNKIHTGSQDAYISTGLKRLDDFLGGGLRPGQLHVVLGATGSGKTAFASQICDYAVESGKRALMFSMEVDPMDIFIRDIERNAGVSRWDLKRHGKDEAMRELMVAHSKMLGQKNKVVYGEPISVEGIRQAILTERLRTGPIDLVVVDHAQVTAPSKDDKRSMPRYLQVKSTAESLRALARQLNVAIVLTAQMNPTPKGETPTMALVRESKDINNTAEVVMMIYHEKSEGMGGETIITKSWLVLEKVRAGREGKIQIVYMGHLFKFGEAYSGEEG